MKSTRVPNSDERKTKTTQIKQENHLTKILDDVLDELIAGQNSQSTLPVQNPINLDKILDDALDELIVNQSTCDITSEVEKKLFSDSIHSNLSSHLFDPKEERAKALKQITESYKLGIYHYQSGKLNEAEQEFITVLRPVLSRPEAQSLYVSTKDIAEEVLSSMYYLGQIYLKDEQYTEHHAKAAGIFQYCAGFAKKYGVSIKLNLLEEVGDEHFFANQAYLVEEAFLSSVGRASIDISLQDNVAKCEIELDQYKNDLTQLREKTESKIKNIKDWPLERIVDRAKEVEAIYQDSNGLFVNNASNKYENPGLVQKLLSSCFKQLGNVPKECEYSIISLGSLASGRMTPWSDLEFAILVNKDEPEFKDYFRNLTKLLHIKIINLGETPLRSMGVESLNNFRTTNKQDDWFWDDILDNGFSFDGPDWHACKTPLGRQGGYKTIKKDKLANGIEQEIIIDKSDFELILTPKQLASFQKEELQEDATENWFKSDLYLVQALRLVSLIDGSQVLLDDYRREVKQAASEQVVKDRALTKLKRDINIYSLKLGNEEEGKLIDIKKDIFRIGDRIVDGLANYYQIMATEGTPGLTVWVMINKMEEAEILSEEGAGHLKEAISIATELRLATYCHNKGQKEGFSTYEPAVEHLSEKQKKQLLEETFYIKDTSILHHFYYVMLDLQELITIFCNNYKEIERLLKSSELFDNSNYNQGLVHSRFLEYDQAIKYMEAEKEEQPQNLKFLEHLYHLYNKVGDINKAIETAQRMLKDAHEVPNINSCQFAIIYHNLGHAYHNNVQYDKAIEYYNKALNCATYNFIGITYNGLGAIYHDQGKYDEAIEFYRQSLSVFYEDTDKAMCYNNLALTYKNKGEVDKAVEYYKKSLDTLNEVSKHSPNHSIIATIYNNLGGIQRSNEQYDLAIKYYDQSLKIKLKIYINNHPSIAITYNNLGETYDNKTEYDKAIECYQQALTILTGVYGDNHPNTVTVYNNITITYTNLGIVYFNKKENNHAIEHFEKALAIQKILYEDNLNYKEIIDNSTKLLSLLLYDNLIILYNSKGEFNKVIKYYNAIVNILDADSCTQYFNNDSDVYRSVVNAYVVLAYNYYQSYQGDNKLYFHLFFKESGLHLAHKEMVEQVVIELSECGLIESSNANQSYNLDDDDDDIMQPDPIHVQSYNDDSNSIHLDLLGHNDQI